MESADQHIDSAIPPPEGETKNIADANNPPGQHDKEEKPEESDTPEETTTSVEPSPAPEPVPVEPPSMTKEIVKLDTDQNPDAEQKSTIKPEPVKKNVERSKDDEKLAMYKALAIKLKKELVKSRDELAELKESSQAESNTLRGKVDLLEKSLDSERQTNEASVATLKARIRTIQQQLDSTETELQTIQDEFESYKVMASKIMQQNASSHPNSNKAFEEERYKQLKELSDDQRKRISHLESQLDTSSKKNEELSKKSHQLQDDLNKLRDKMKALDKVVERCEILSHENDNLKLALDQFRSKLKEPHCHQNRDTSVKTVKEDSKPPTSDFGCNTLGNDDRIKTSTTTATTIATSSSPTIIDNIGEGVSPSASLKDESQTNSSSSYDGSTTSGYVHIKPATFEIISRSSVLDDAQNQIDNLTKAYLDSESTNSLLTEQVEALKEEIRRLQRGSERLVLAENLEYLKNVVFKFISLDSSQAEQKQRLIPVLSTVLKLSPEETAKLNTLNIAERPSMASSFFKL